MGNGLSYFTDLLPHSPGQSTTLYYNGSIIGRLVGNMGDKGSFKSQTNSRTLRVVLIASIPCSKERGWQVFAQVNFV
jgi:hypothetical protein